MKFLSNLTNISLVCIASLLSKKVYAENPTIQIFAEKPDFLTETNWNSYATYLNGKSFQVNGKNGASNAKVQLNFNQAENYVNFDTEVYTDYFKSIAEEIQKSNYDMFIVDDKFLFGDYSNIKSELVAGVAKLVDYHKQYVDLTEEIKKEELSFHNEEVLSRCYLNNHLYALPFEMDFDVIYSRNANLQNELEFKNWNDLLTMNQNGNLLSAGYGEKGKLLDIFMEFVESDREHIYKDEASYFDIFYNDKAKSLYEPFKNFITKSNVKNVPSSLGISLKDAYDSFTNGETDLFFGKASHYRSLVQT
eukprot:jgi/Orpsp1_1/1180405/evm.model.c7180000073299.1